MALAAALGPGRCEIYTDVSGVLTADPRLVKGARVIPKLSYRACSALAHLGGRVLHARCVDLAARERVPLAVRSSFRDGPGTEISDDPMEELNKAAAPAIVVGFFQSPLTGILVLAYFLVYQQFEN